MEKMMKDDNDLLPDGEAELHAYVDGRLDRSRRAEVEARLASGQFERNSSWWGGFFVYLPTLLVGALPWLPAWLALARRRDFARPLAEPVDRLLLAWI